jgi:hypothetical protein
MWAIEISNLGKVAQYEPKAVVVLNCCGYAASRDLKVTGEPAFQHRVKLTDQHVLQEDLRIEEIRLRT